MLCPFLSTVRVLPGALAAAAPAQSSCRCCGLGRPVLEKTQKEVSEMMAGWPRAAAVAQIRPCQTHPRSLEPEEDGFERLDSRGPLLEDYRESEGGPWSVRTAINLHNLQCCWGSTLPLWSIQLRTLPETSGKLYTAWDWRQEFCGVVCIMRSCVFARCTERWFRGGTSS